MYGKLRVWPPERESMLRSFAAQHVSSDNAPAGMDTDYLVHQGLDISWSSPNRVQDMVKGQWRDKRWMRREFIADNRGRISFS